MAIGNKIRAVRSQREEDAEQQRQGRSGRARTNARPRRNSILPDNPLTPVPETNEEDGDAFIFTITNSRGETRAITAADQAGRDRRTVGGATGSRNRSRDKLSDAQRVGFDAPPTYDQAVTERRISN